MRRFRPASRNRGSERRFLRVALAKLATAVALLSLLAPALALGKDEPTSKNYQTKLDAIRPAVQGLSVTTEGGDRYLVVKNDTGKTLSVAGYDDEPYLRFLPNGDVQANANSPATYLNAIRFGTPENVTIPRSALASTKVKWKTVAGNGSYRWFDHRIHWMEKRPAAGREGPEHAHQDLRLAGAGQCRDDARDAGSARFPGSRLPPRRKGAFQGARSPRSWPVLIVLLALLWLFLRGRRRTPRPTQPRRRATSPRRRPGEGGAPSGGRCAARSRSS